MIRRHSGVDRQLVEEVAGKFRDILRPLAQGAVHSEITFRR